jgi:hypothetical protein
MKAFDCGVPTLAFGDNEVLIQALLMADQNIYLTRSARPALQDNVVFDADFASFVQRSNQPFEASPIRDQFSNLHDIGRPGIVALSRFERKCAKSPIDFAGISRVGLTDFSLIQRCGFKSLPTASATIKGFEVMRMIRKWQSLMPKSGAAGEARFVNASPLDMARQERQIAPQARQCNRAKRTKAIQDSLPPASFHRLPTMNATEPFSLRSE